MNSHYQRLFKEQFGINDEIATWWECPQELIKMVCAESNVACTVVDRQGRPLSWAWNMVGGKRQNTVVQNVTSNSVTYSYAGEDYLLRQAPDAGSCRQSSSGNIQLNVGSSRKIGLVINGRGNVARTAGLLERRNHKQF